jgi:hypothetical protein
MRKEDGCQWYHLIWSPFKLFSLKFSNKLVQAPFCEGHKMLREPCFYYLQTLIVSQ